MSRLQSDRPSVIAEVERTREPWVVVGLDGRSHDSDALALAERLRAAVGGKALLVHVIPPAPIGRGMAESEAIERAQGAELLDRAATGLGETYATELLEPCPAAPGLSRIAREREAAVLVLGSSHRGPLGRIVPGAVASRLLAQAPCPIAVAPGGYAKYHRRPISSIGVAYDTTAASDLALQAAAAAAERLGVPLRLYHAMYPVPKDPAWDEFRGHMQDFARQILKGGTRQLPASLEVTTRVLEGHAAEVIADAAERDGIDLLYVGCRGYGPLREALFGGVAGALLQAVSVPLVIVPTRRGAPTELDKRPFPIYR
jgi:nucleotide-binding universal stress UspA family protein